MNLLEKIKGMWALPTPEAVQAAALDNARRNLTHHEEQASYHAAMVSVCRDTIRRYTKHPNIND